MINATFVFLLTRPVSSLTSNEQHYIISLELEIRYLMHVLQKERMRKGHFLLQQCYQSEDLSQERTH